MAQTNTNPTWWNDDMTSGWQRVKTALKRDWEQTKRDFSDKSGKELNQDVGDTVRQAAGKEAIPPGNVPNPPDFDRDEDAVRYGWGASGRYRDQGDWSDRVEAKLKEEWNDLKSGRTWEEIKGSVRQGWDYDRRSPRALGTPWASGPHHPHGNQCGALRLDTPVGGRFQRLSAVVFSACRRSFSAPVGSRFQRHSA